MFIKEREAPHDLECLPRLMHRLPKHHPSWQDVYVAHYITKAGFGGEKEIDRLLRRSRWKECLFIGDLYLRDSFCQIDTLVLTPYFTLILEVKNYTGTLIFDERSLHMRQETREGKLIGYNSPVTQAWNAREELLVLFEKLSISMPVYAAIVLPYSSTLVENTPVELPVIYGNSLNRFISNLPRTGRPLSIEEISRVGKLLIEHHSPCSKKDYPTIYKYKLKDLKKGVLCPECGAPGNHLSTRTHFCIKCELKILDGHRRALDDWFALVSPEIRNGQCQKFLDVKNKDAAQYILTKLGLKRRGSAGKYAYYK